ncbi:MAG: MazG nucleotide pyrophosphohydrolase domain-containing protein [Patescibacteria group bacterium]
MNKEQKALDAWYRKIKWPYWAPEWVLARLTEEVGEFARAINHEYGPKKRKTEEGSQEIEAELGDILFTLACYANQKGINLDTALANSLKKVKERDKNRF